MLNLDKIRIFVVCLVVCVFAGAVPSRAEQRYVIDSLVVSLREGPGSSYKTVTTVQTGQLLEVVETQNDYIRVRTADGGEGWLLNQYATEKPPNVVLVKELQGKIDSLTDQNTQLAAQLAEIEAQKEGGENYANPEITKLQEKLDSLTKEYEQLERDAEDTIQFRNDNKQLKEDLATARANISELQTVNSSLRQRQKIYWFLAGGLVFWIGWMTGKVSFRRSRHSLTL